MEFVTGLLLLLTLLLKSKLKTILETVFVVYKKSKRYKNDRVFVITKTPADYGIMWLNSGVPVVRLPVHAFLYLAGMENLSFDLGSTQQAK